MSLTQEQAVRIGMTFRALSHTEHLDEVIELLKAQYTQQITASDYADANARENAFRQLRALDELIGTINTFIAIAEADTLEGPFSDDNIFE